MYVSELIGHFDYGKLNFRAVVGFGSGFGMIRVIEFGCIEIWAC
jgi:hypothetical protein